MSDTLIVAGPCSAETEEQVFRTAELLADMGVEYYRAGIWKPRTSPNSFDPYRYQSFRRTGDSRCICQV